VTKLAKSTVALAINRFCPPLFGFILLVFVGRKSSELLGWYTVVTVFFFALQTLPFLGLTPLVVKEAARRPQEAGRIFATMVGLALAVTALLCAALPSVLAAAELPAEVDTAVWICVLTTVPYIVAYSAELILVSFHEPRLLSVVPVAENTVRVGLSLIALELGGGLPALFWLTFGGRVLAAAAFAWELRRRVLRGQPMRFERAIARAWLSQSPVFLTHAVTFLIASRAAYVALSDPIAIAHFSVGYRVLDLGTIGLTAFVGAVYPSLARAAARADREEFAFISLKSTKLALAGALAFVLAGLLGAEAFVALLFPVQYPGAVPVMRLLVLSFVFVGVRLSVSGILFSSDRPWIDLQALFGGSLVYVGLLAWLVPAHGVRGAAVATVVDALFQMGVRMWFARECFRAAALARERMARMALVSAACLAACFLLDSSIGSSYWKAGAGAVLAGAYGVALLQSGALGDDDFRFLGLERLRRWSRVLRPARGADPTSG
jgi:O-antigen/teichoic acid export membrane protein